MAVVRRDESGVVTYALPGSPLAGVYNIGTPLTPTGGIAVGDLLVMTLRFWFTYSSPATINLNAPAGWTLRTSAVNSGGVGTNGWGHRTWTRIADGTAGDTPSLTVTKTGAPSATWRSEITMFGLSGGTWSILGTGSTTSTGGVSDAASQAIGALSAGTNARIVSFAVGNGPFVPSGSVPTMTTANGFTSRFARNSFIVQGPDFGVSDNVFATAGTYSVPRWNVTNLYTSSGTTHVWILLRETPTVETDITVSVDAVPNPTPLPSGDTVEFIVKWTITAANPLRLNFKLGIALDPASYDVGSTFAVSLGGGGYSGENPLAAASTIADPPNEYTYTPGGEPYIVRIRYRLVAGAVGVYPFEGGWVGYDLGPVEAESGWTPLDSFEVTEAPIPPTFTEGFVTNASDPWSLVPGSALNLPPATSVVIGDRWYYAERVEGGNTIIVDALDNLAALDTALGVVDQAWSNDGSGWVNAIPALEGLGITFPITGPQAFPNVGFSPALDGIIVYSGLAIGPANPIAHFGFTYSWTDSPAGSHNGIRTIAVTEPEPPPTPTFAISLSSSPSLPIIGQNYTITGRFSVDINATSDATFVLDMTLVTFDAPNTQVSIISARYRPVDSTIPGSWTPAATGAGEIGPVDVGASWAATRVWEVEATVFADDLIGAGYPTNQWLLSATTFDDVTQVADAALIIRGIYPVQPDQGITIPTCLPGSELGVGRDLRVLLLARGGTAVLAELNPVSGSFTRDLDTTSNLELNGVTTGLLGESCCEGWDQIYPWSTEIIVYRDGRDAWCGPVTGVEFGYGTVKVTASDLTAWWDRRVLETDLTFTNQDLSDILVALHNAAMAPDPIDNFTLDATPSNVLGTRTYLANDYKYISDLIAELSKTGVDWSAYGRHIFIGGEEVPSSPYVTLTDDFWTTPPTLAHRGNEQATKVVVKGKGVTGVASAGPEYIAYYGELVRVFDESTIEDTPSAMAAAETRVQILKDQIYVETPNGAGLKPTAPITLPELVPGIRVRVATSASCRQITEDFRLKAVKVDLNGQVSISLQPIGTIGSL